LPAGRDLISAFILFSAPRSEHSAQAEVLDMQEVTGSSPVSPPTTLSTLNLTV